MVEVIAIVSVLLLFSMTFNIFLIWYIKTTLSKLLFVSENLLFLKEAIEAYAKHLKTIYQLETYYGDETIKFLFEHTKALLTKILDFDDVIALSDKQELILDDREVEIVDSTHEEKEETIENPQEKHVFYGGSRRGNS